MHTQVETRLPARGPVTYPSLTVLLLRRFVIGHGITYRTLTVVFVMTSVHTTPLFTFVKELSEEEQHAHRLSLYPWKLESKMLDK